MPEVQKETYLNIILSKACSENYFIAKSSTLDFLFGFENPYSGMVYLNECLNEDNQLAKISLNSIYGILLAVKEYKEFHQTSVIYRFVKTLIDVLNYKIDDTSISNYKECMEMILEFIRQNINFKLIIPLFELSKIFQYYEGKNDQRETILKKYCNVLKDACNELQKENTKLLCFKLERLKKELNEQELSPDSILSQVNNIINSIFQNSKKKLLIVSNIENEKDSLANNILKENEQIEVSVVEKEEIKDIRLDDSLRVLFLIDFKNDDFGEYIYWFGVMEGKMEKNHLLGCFYNPEIINTNVTYQKLIDRYADKHNLDDKLTNLLH